MRFGVNIVGDLVRLMEAEVKAGEKAVTTAMRDAGTGLKTAWRAQITGAGLGPRLANSIRRDRAKGSRPPRWSGPRPLSSSVRIMPGR